MPRPTSVAPNRAETQRIAHAAHAARVVPAVAARHLFLGTRSPRGLALAGRVRRYQHAQPFRAPPDAGAACLHRSGAAAAAAPDPPSRRTRSVADDRVSGDLPSRISHRLLRLQVWLLRACTCARTASPLP